MAFKRLRLSYLLSIRSLTVSVLGWFGRHPIAAIVLPSIWLIARYDPFWNGTDALEQLIAKANSFNLLHYPPIYCFLGRVPFWVCAVLTRGSAPSLFDIQNVSILSARVLVIAQHIALWAALRYFVFSFPLSDVRRGGLTILLSSVASFYAFAHTAASEAATAVSWIAAFAAAVRIIAKPSVKRDWAIYTLALLVAIGSRTVNAILLIGFPTLFLGLLAYVTLSKFRRSLRRRFAVISVSSMVISVCLFVAERALVSSLCSFFGVVVRSTDGETFSDRFGTVIAKMSAPEKAAFLAAALTHAADENVRAAIAAQFRFKTYYHGADEAIAELLASQGWSGEKLEAERDGIILRATLCMYQAAPTRLLFQIAKEFVRTLVPTSDARVARVGPCNMFQMARAIDGATLVWGGRMPSDPPRLPCCVLGQARPALAKFDNDFVVDHWRGVPLLIWLILFGAVGIVRKLRGAISTPLLLFAAGFVLLGLATDFAACVLAYGDPRYALPLLTTIFVSGAAICFGSNLGESETRRPANQESRLATVAR